MVLVVDGRELRKGREKAREHSIKAAAAEKDLRSGRIFSLGILLEGLVYYGSIIVLVGLLLTQSNDSYVIPLFVGHCDYSLIRARLRDASVTRICHKTEI